MTDSVSFKAYLKRDGQEVEVRRFGIDGGAATNYMYLKGKIMAMFPSIQNDQFSVFWQDSDKDYILIESDEELVEALSANTVQPMKVYVNVKTQQQPQGGSSQQTHAGVTCDACNGPVVGYRYKCVTCPDYDLCAKCEAARGHPEHFMLRMPTPLASNTSRPKFLRKFLVRPHKFHKRHNSSRCAQGLDGADPAGTCPFSRRDYSAPGMAAGFAGIADMFDFSALMEFINSLGVQAGEETAANGPTASAQASTSTQSPPGTQAQPSSATQTPPGAQASSSANAQATAASSSQTSYAQAGHSSQRPPAPNPTEYLTGIGQAIQAFLDPFGVDVTFDVRSKQNDKEPTSNSQQTSTASSRQTTPQPAPTTETPAPSPHSQPEAAVPSASGPVATHVDLTNATPGVSGRRNSDDWTLLNRESPTRGDVTAMDVEVGHGVAVGASVYPELQHLQQTPSAPPQAEPTQDPEQLRIQAAMDSIRAMGFNFDPSVLQELLKKENCNIASVLEVILGSAGKK